MNSLAWLLIREYVRSWKIVVELVLVTLVVTTGFLQKGQPLGNIGAIGLFTLLLVPITTLRVSRNAASMKCRYLLATGLGRTAYLLAVALASFFIVSALLASTVIVAVFKSSDVLGMNFVERLFLLWVLLTATLLISMLLSRLVAGKWGTGTLVILLAITGLSSENSFREPLIKPSREAI